MSDFANYSHLITTRPHDIRQVIISDLHLAKSEPALVQAFLSLIADLTALPNLQSLYILGDWFDAWVGDDAYLTLSAQAKGSHWITPIISRLKTLRRQGCDILVMHGNRDFLIGQPFCNTFGGRLIKEPYSLTIGDKAFRLEHGDALCTDDKAYQRFRKLMRNRLVQWYLLNKSLEKRLKIAEKIRQKSQRGNAKKAAFIMDVNTEAVVNAIKGFDALIHGHTHRPARHHIALPPSLEASNAVQKSRFVLGDWRIFDQGGTHQRIEAVVGMVVGHPPSSLQSADRSSARLDMISSQGGNTASDVIPSPRITSPSPPSSSLAACDHHQPLRPPQDDADFILATFTA